MGREKINPLKIEAQPREPGDVNVRDVAVPGVGSKPNRGCVAVEQR